MTEAVRALVVAVVLAASAFAVFVLRLSRLDPAGPARLVGELRLSQWMALFLSAIGGAWLGVAALQGPLALGGVEVTLAVATIVAGGWSMLREVRQSLLWLSVAFLAHALVDISHRPGWLTPDLAPRSFTIGCAVLNVYLAALCFWVQRR